MNNLGIATLNMVITSLRAAQVLSGRHANHGFEVMTEVRLIGIACPVSHLGQRFGSALLQQLAGKSDPVQALSAGSQSPPGCVARRAD